MTVIWDALAAHQSVTDIEREIERIHPAAFGWALACCCRDRCEAEDVLQVAYMKIIEGKARFNGQSSFKTFLFAVIRRTAAERRRRAILHSLTLEKRRHWTVRSPQQSADQALQNRQESSALVAALAKLATRQREVLELVFYHDMTVEEAAQTLRISVGSARVHYDRGKKNLARLVKIDG